MIQDINDLSSIAPALYSTHWCTVLIFSPLVHCPHIQSSGALSLCSVLWCTVLMFRSLILPLLMWILRHCSMQKSGLSCPLC